MPASATTKGLWTFSNGLSLLRGVLTLPTAWCLWNGYASAVLALSAAAYVTDLLDGWLARRLNEITEAGKVIDPLADKIFVGVNAVILLVQGKIPLWFMAAILTRDVVIMLAGLYLARKTNFVLPSNYPGKIAVVCVAFTLISVVAEFPPVVVTVGLTAASAMMALSFALYAKRFVQILRTL